MPMGQFCSANFATAQFRVGPWVVLAGYVSTVGQRDSRVDTPASLEGMGKAQDTQT